VKQIFSQKDLGNPNNVVQYLNAILIADAVDSIRKRLYNEVSLAGKVGSREGCLMNQIPRHLGQAHRMKRQMLYRYCFRAAGLAAFRHRAGVRRRGGTAAGISIKSKQSQREKYI
jgi:hypothetical protein